MTEKEMAQEISAIKVCLVACGFKESLPERTDSPVWSKQSLWMHLV